MGGNKALAEKAKLCGFPMKLKPLNFEQEPKFFPVSMER